MDRLLRREVLKAGWELAGAEAEGIVCPWAEAVLADRDGLARRWEEAPTGVWWDLDVVRWRVQHGRDLPSGEAYDQRIPEGVHTRSSRPPAEGLP